MGWQVKIKTENEVTKYRIWTTISDGWITEWLTKEEITKFFLWQRLRDFRDKFLEDAITFPNNYTDKDTDRRIYDDKVVEDYTKFVYESHRGKKSDEILFKKFSEVLTAHGLSVKITDERGYSFDSTEKENESEKVSDVITNEPKYLLGVLKNIESNMPKTERKRKSNVSIVKDYLMCHTSKGGRTSSYEMCEYLGIDADAYTFHDNGTLHHVKPTSKTK